MIRPLRNRVLQPPNFGGLPWTTPTEQDVYATAALQIAVAHQAGATTHVIVEQVVCGGTMPFGYGQLEQLARLGAARSS